MRAAAAICWCKADTIRMLGEDPRGNLTAYRRLDVSIDLYGIDTSHFSPKQSSVVLRRKRLEDLLARDTVVNSGRLRERLIDAGLKSRACEGCGRSRWAGQRIPLELDHVDGDRTNNELDNLRVLCPNCHALTPTYRGRNIGRRSGSDDPPAPPPIPGSGDPLDA